MKQKSILLVQFLFVFYLFAGFQSALYAEKIITAKEDLPDSYYGLKMGAILTPTLGFRLRDSSSGISNALPNDRTGFSMPWTLITLSKEWEEKNIMMEVWGELTRNNTLSADTQVDSGTKSNPYVLQIRRANIQKKILFNRLETKIIFGIQELAHVHTQWNNNWRWRYMDRAPAESLGFAPQPADLGLSMSVKYSDLEFYLGVMNGEGYREVQNTDSSAFDIYSRISFEKQFESQKAGLHFISRFANSFGASGTECKEGKSTCLASDGNPNTFLEKDFRSKKSQSFGLEFTYEKEKLINFGLGGIFKRKFGGMTLDQFHQGTSPAYEKDSIGKAIYAWIGFTYTDFTVGYRQETGTGRNGVIGTTYSESIIPYNSFHSPSPGIANPTLSTGLPNYSSKAYFTRNTVFIEYIYDATVRFGIGAVEISNYDSKGFPQKTYIDSLGQERTEAQYLAQGTLNSGTIVPYLDRRDRQFFIKALIDF